MNLKKVYNVDVIVSRKEGVSKYMVGAGIKLRFFVILVRSFIVELLMLIWFK